MSCLSFSIVQIPISCKNLEDNVLTILAQLVHRLLLLELALVSLGFNFLIFDAVLLMGCEGG